MSPDPSGFAAQYTYTALGYLSALKDNGTGQVFWTANALDAEMHVLQQTAGNGVITNQSFNANTGRIASVQAGAANVFANLAFGFDTVGNLTSRSDFNQSLSETFQYDTLNRLTSYQVNTDPAKTVGYDQLGNITTKSDVGTYSYPAAGQARPHAVSGISGVVNASYTYDNNGNPTGDGSRNLTWTSYNMAAGVSQGATAVTYLYDCEHQRLTQSTAQGTTVYLRDPASGVVVEQFVGAGGSQWNEYLYAAGRVVAARYAFSDQTVAMRYFIADNLGSTVALTDELTQLAETNSYDAWGKRRYPSGADDPTGSIASQTTRGFTGQEHLPAVGLVNYNARLYDPTIGRFMGADSIVPNALSGQSFNRYSYVANNPLSLIDPSGHFPDEVVTVTAWRIHPIDIGYVPPEAQLGNTGGFNENGGPALACATVEEGGASTESCGPISRPPPFSLIPGFQRLFGVTPAEAAEPEKARLRGTCPTGPAIDNAKTIIRAGTNAQIAGAGIWIMGAGVDLYGRNPAWGTPMMEFGGGLAKTGTAMQISGATMLGANGMYGDAINTALIAYIDKFNPLPEPVQGFTDKPLEDMLENFEQSSGMDLNSCDKGD